MGNKHKPQDNKRLLAVQINLGDLIEFYRMCSDMGIKTEEEMSRALVIYCKIKQSKGMQVWSTTRNKEDFINHLSREYGKILYLKNKTKKNKKGE